jgi:hypothetical protein
MASVHVAGWARATVRSGYMDWPADAVAVIAGGPGDERAVARWLAVSGRTPGW